MSGGQSSQKPRDTLVRDFRNPELQGLIDATFGDVYDFATDLPDPFSVNNETLAPVDPLTTQARQGMVNIAPRAQAGAENAFNANQQTIGAGGVGIGNAQQLSNNTGNTIGKVNQAGNAITPGLRGLNQSTAGIGAGFNALSQSSQGVAPGQAILGEAGRGVGDARSGLTAAIQGITGGLQGLDAFQNQALSGNSNAARDFLLSGALLDPSSNPVLAAHTNAALRPIAENVSENLLPNMRDQFVGANMFGSSRQGIAEGLIAKEAIQQMADVSTNIQNNSFNQGLDSMVRALQDTTGAGIRAAEAQAAQGTGAAQALLGAGVDAGGQLLGQGTAAGGDLYRTGTGAAGNLFDTGAQTALGTLAQEAQSSQGLIDAMSTSLGLAPELLTNLFETYAQLEGVGDRNRGDGQIAIEDARANYNEEAFAPFQTLMDVFSQVQGLGGASTLTDVAGFMTPEQQAALGGAVSSLQASEVPGTDAFMQALQKAVNDALAGAPQNTQFGPFPDQRS